MGENNEDGLEVKMVEMKEKDKDDVCEVELISEENEQVKWEEFMPRMIIRVLLVEADHSTRHILTALLRKCNYKVAAVADGLKAWEILKKRHNCIDLVLTELDLPSISGYALLSLIMEHDGCKNIPVIMMSSQDSISMVLKCILKGAADFLIKPVRKNELKNLWRHVWKRLAINDGHNPQKLAAQQHNVEATFENDIATNHSEDNVSTSLKSSKCGDKANDGQDFSWMKCGDGEETRLSTKEKEHYLKNVKIEKGLALLTTEGKEGRLESSGQSNNEGDVSIALREDEDRSSTGLATADDNVGPIKCRRKANGDDQRSSDPSRGVIDLIGCMKRQKCVASQASYNGDFSNLNSTPELNLSLTRVHDSETKDVDERLILNHSNASAFSWYNSNKKSQTCPPLSISEVTEVKGVSDPSPCPKTININQDDKPIVGPQGVWTGCAPMYQPMSSPLAGPNPDISAKSSKSALHKEMTLLTSPSLHSDQAEREIENASSQIVGPSCSSTSCNEFADPKKTNACASSSDLTDSNANGPPMTGRSVAKEVVKVEGCNTFELDQFKRRTSHHSAEREAALAKFRLKRKGRCFEKKVRYQSRKTLAEQRLRVKGQFVRHIPTDQILTRDGKT